MHVTTGPLDFTAPVSTLLWAAVALSLFRGALQVWLAYLPATLSTAVMADLRRTLFDRFTHTSWSVQAAERDGYFQSLMSTTVTYASQAIIRLAAGITSVLMFVTLLASAFVLSVWTALVLVGASVVLFLVLAPLSRRQRAQTRKLVSENVEFAQGVEEIVLVAEEMQVFGAAASYRGEIERLIRRVRRPLLYTRFLIRAVPALYQSVAYLLLVIALAMVYLSGGTAIAELGAVVLILVRSLTFGQQMQTAAAGLNELLPYVSQLRQAMDTYSAQPRQDGDRSLGRVERLGTVRGVVRLHPWRRRAPRRVVRGPAG